MPRPYARPARRAEIPLHVLRVAQHLFEANGYANVTMEQIAAEAAVSKRTLYKYFSVKEALLERVLEVQLAKDLAGRNFHIDMHSRFDRNVLHLLHRSAQWCEQHNDYLLPYIRHKFATFDPGEPAQRDGGLLPVWRKLIAAAQERAELRADRSADQLATYFHYLYLGALMRWLTQSHIDLRSEFDMVVGLFVEGAGPGAALPSTCNS